MLTITEDMGEPNFREPSEMDSVTDEALLPNVSAGSIDVAVDTSQPSNGGEDVSQLPALTSGGAGSDNVARSHIITTANDSQATTTRLPQLLTDLAMPNEYIEQAGMNEDVLELLLNMQGQKRARLLRWLMLEDSLQKYVMMGYLKPSVIGHKPRQAFLTVNAGEGDALLVDDTTAPKHYLSCQPRLKPKGQSLMVETHRALQKLYATRGFIQEGSLMLEKIWFFYLLSFMIEDFYYYFAYPKERFGDTPLKILLAQSAYERLLSKSLTSPVVWPVLFGVPLIRGVVTAYQRIKGVHKYLDLETLTNELTQAYGIEGGGIWRHTVSWFMPFKKASEKLEAVYQTLVWDGRVSLSDHRQAFTDGHIEPSQRLEAFQAIRALAREGRQIGQWYAMSTLADIAYSVDHRDFERLKRYGIQDKTLLELMRIESEAYQSLRELTRFDANKPEGRTKQALRCMTAHYLIWGLGKPESLALQPLFYAFKAIRLYVRVRLYVTIIQGIQILLDERRQRLNCEDKGWQWIFREDAGKFLCSACGNAPIRWISLEDPQTCLDEMMGVKRSVPELVKFFGSLDMRNVKNLDFVNQIYPNTEEDIEVKLNPDLLPVLMPILSEQGQSLKNITFYAEYGTIIVDPESLESIIKFLNKRILNCIDIGGFQLDVKNQEVYFNLFKVLPNRVNILKLGRIGLNDNSFHILANYLPGSLLQRLIVEDNNIGDNGVKILVQNLSRSQLLELNFDGNTINYEGAEALGQSLSGSVLQILNLDFNDIGNVGAQALGQGLPGSQLQSLELRGSNIGDLGAEGLGQGLPGSQLQSLELSENNIGNPGAITLGQGIHDSLLQTLDLGSNNITGEGIVGLVQNLKGSVLENLMLDNNNIGDIGAVALGQVLRDTSLQELVLHVNKISDLGAKGLAQGLLGSKLQFLSLNANDIGAEGSTALAEGMINTDLRRLSLYANDIDDGGIIALGQSISKSELQGLSLGGTNFFGDVGVKAIAHNLKYSNLIYLDLRDNYNIEDESAMALGQAIEESGLLVLYLLHNNIGDLGATELARGVTGSQLLELYLSYNDIHNAGATAFGSDLLGSQLKILDLSHNNIEDVGMASLSRGLIGSKLEDLDLNQNEIGDLGAISLANYLIEQVRITRAPWIYRLDSSRDVGTKLYNPTTQLKRLNLNENFIGNDGALKLCETYLNANISLILMNNNSNITEVEVDPCQVSSASTIRPTYSYILFYRLLVQFYKSSQSLYQSLLVFLGENFQPNSDLTSESIPGDANAHIRQPCYDVNGRIANVLHVRALYPRGLIPACRYRVEINAPPHDYVIDGIALIQQAGRYSFSLSFFPALLKDACRSQGMPLELAQAVRLGTTLTIIRYHSGSFLDSGIHTGLGLFIHQAYRRLGLSDAVAKHGTTATMVMMQLGLLWPTSLNSLLGWSAVLGSSLCLSRFGEYLESLIAYYGLGLNDELTNVDATDTTDRAVNKESDSQTASLLNRLDVIEAGFKALQARHLTQYDIKWYLWCVEDYRADIAKAGDNADTLDELSEGIDVLEEDYQTALTRALKASEGTLNTSHSKNTYTLMTETPEQLGNHFSFFRLSAEGNSIAQLRRINRECPNKCVNVNN